MALKTRDFRVTCPFDRETNVALITTVNASRTYETVSIAITSLLSVYSLSGDKSWVGNDFRKEEAAGIPLPRG